MNDGIFSCRLNVCSVPGCFLKDLSNPDSQYVKYFKKSKEELTQKLYCLYNSTVFEQKVGFKIKQKETQSNLHFYSYKNLVIVAPRFSMRLLCVFFS